MCIRDSDMPGAAVHDPLCRLHEIHFLGELPCFAIVKGHHVDVLEKLDQVGTTALNPEIHRVACNQLRFLYLFEHVELKTRVDVAEKYERSVPELLRNLRTEAREHTKMCLESLSRIQVVTVPAPPAE